MNTKQLFACGVCASVLATFAAAVQASPTLWTGPTVSFNKANFSDPTLAADQDRLTAGVWLTRGSSQGLYNAHNEAGFSHFASPSDTEWADGTLANYASLHYTDWNSWAKGIHGGPITTVGVPAVLHLKAEDIYMSIDFTSWTSGGAGGGFSYTRSSLAVPEPSGGLLLLAGLGLTGYAVRRRAR